MLYEYQCENCGYKAEILQFSSTEVVTCIKCGTQMNKLISAPARIVINTKERLPLGSGSRGKFIPPEKGRRAIFVPSFGTMEKEEIDYVVEVAQEQEDERIKRNEKSATKERLEQVVEATRQAPRGKRAKTAREIISG